MLKNQDISSYETQLLINVNMLTVVCILIFMSRINCSVEMSMKKIYNLKRQAGNRKWMLHDNFLHTRYGYQTFYPGIENLILPMLSYPGCHVRASYIGCIATHAHCRQVMSLLC